MTAVRQVRAPSKKSGVAVQAGQQANAHVSRTPVPPSAFVPPIPHLQQTVGNRAVQHLARSCPVFPSRCPFGGACHTCPARAQAKLKIGEPTDKHEREADRLAEAVMCMPEPGVSEDAAISEGVQRPRIQRVCSECDEELRRHPEEEEGILQSQKALGGTLAVTSELGAGLDAVRGGGQPLPESVRAFFEPRFGYDFSHVRIHTDAQAAASARAVNALAYTVGPNVVFGSGQYAPRTSAGQRLLAHELTHVAQQGQAGRLGTIPRDDTVSVGRCTTGSERRVQRQLVTPLAPGGGYRGLMERDRRRLLEARTAPSPPPETCDIRLCFLPLQVLLDMGVEPELAYLAAHHVFIRYDGQSVGFTRCPGESIRDARVISPEPRAEPRSPYERCVLARFRTIPTPTLGQIIHFSPADTIGDLISYGLDVVHGVQHCPTPSCALARYRIARLLRDDRRGLYDLFDENCETWARKVLAAACLQAPEIRLGGLGNIVVNILNETTLGRLYRAGRLVTGRTRPFAPTRAPALPCPPSATRGTLPSPPAPGTVLALPAAPAPPTPTVITFSRTGDAFTTNTMGKEEHATDGFRLRANAVPLFRWAAHVTINARPGDPCHQWEVGPHQVARAYWHNVYWGAGAHRTRRRGYIDGGLPMRDATAAGNTWYHDPLARAFSKCGDKRNTNLNDSPRSAWIPWNNPKPGRMGNSGSFNYGFGFVSYISARDTTKGAGAAAFRPIAHLYWNFSVDGTFDASKPVGSRVTITAGGKVNRSRPFAGGNRTDPSMHGGPIVNDRFRNTDA